jgi:PAS domain S-box-containing protein
MHSVFDAETRSSSDLTATADSHGGAGYPMTKASTSDRPEMAGLLLCFAAHILAAAFGQWMMVIPEVSIAVWPPNGVLLAVLLLNSRASWHWWIAVGAASELTANAIWFHNLILPALGYVVANTLEVFVAASALHYYTKAPLARLTTLGQVLAFLIVGVVAAPVVGATIGAAISAIIGKAPFLVAAPLWWLGDATGVLIATPLVISAVNTWRMKHRPTAAQLLEAAAIAIVLAGLAKWQLHGDLPYGFVLFVPVLWAALRFELRGAVLAVLMLAVAIGFHARDAQDLASPTASVAYRHAMLQALIVVAASMGLITAVIIRQHRQSVNDLAAINTSLEQRVAERTREIRAAEQLFKATFENAAVGISLVNAEGVLLRVNESMAKFLDRPVNELEGRPLDQFTHPDDLSLGKPAWDRLISGAADQYTLEKRYMRKNGDAVWGLAHVSCIRKPGGEIAYLIKIIQDITARKSLDEVRQVLMHEVNHRSKNMLSIIQAVARQTAAKTPQTFIENFDRRLQALATNQDLLVKNGWESIDLDELVRLQLGHFADALRERFMIGGPQVMVSARAAQSLGMALHELATNAAKYGSLSTDKGRIEIVWGIDGDTFHMSWRETGGPAVTKPTATGFGTTVIDAMIASSLSGEVSMDFAPQGLEWRLRAPLSGLQD